MAWKCSFVPSSRKRSAISYRFPFPPAFFTVSFHFFSYPTHFFFSPHYFIHSFNCISFPPEFFPLFLRKAGNKKSPLPYINAAKNVDAWGCVRVCVTVQMPLDSMYFFVCWILTFFYARKYFLKSKKANDIAEPWNPLRWRRGGGGRKVENKTKKINNAAASIRLLILHNLNLFFFLLLPSSAKSHTHRQQEKKERKMKSKSKS